MQNINFLCYFCLPSVLNSTPRTLVLGHKTISEEQFEAFASALATSSQSIVNRSKFVREVYTGMERELGLVGVTGIEDRLQVCNALLCKH